MRWRSRSYRKRRLIVRLRTTFSAPPDKLGPLLLHGLARPLHLEKSPHVQEIFVVVPVTFEPVPAAALARRVEPA